MAVSDGERLVRVWSIGDGSLVHEFDHASRPVSIRFDVTGRWLITEDAAHFLRIWSVEQGGEPVIARQSSGGWTVSIANETVLLGSLGRGFELLNLPRGEAQGDLFHHGVPVDRRAKDAFVAPAGLAPASGFAVTYDGREAVKMWRLPPSLITSAEERGLTPPLTVAAPSIATALSPDGRQLAVATNAGDVRMLAADQQAMLLPDMGQAPGFIGHFGRITRTAFDASGELVASGAFDGSVRVWETASGAPRSFFSNHPDGAIHDLAFTPDGRYVVSATRRSVIVTDAVTGVQLAEARIQSERPRLSVSQDGERIYIAADRGGLTRWIWRGKVSEPLIGPDSGIRAAVVSADESLIVTVDDRRRVELWDAATMEPRDDDIRAAAPVDYLYIAPDNSQVLVQAGVWLNLLSVDPDGLTHRVSRRLEHPPAAVAPQDFGMIARVVTRPTAPRAVVSEILLATPSTEPFEADPEQFVPALESSLGLTLNDWGDPRPIQ